MESSDPALDALLGREIVIDVAAQYVYLGRLTGYDHKYLILEHADVHDLRDTNTTRENYIVDSRRFGVRTNREKVYVRVGDIVSFSPLDDIIA
jgi:small nuclear ribonucleoprotein (snRNP)-like protein